MIYNEIIEKFLDWLFEHEFAYPYSHRTLGSYKSVLMNFATFLDKSSIIDLSSINHAQLKLFFNCNRDNQRAAKSTIIIRSAALNMFFNWAIQSSIIAINPLIEYKNTLKTQREFGGRGGRKPIRLPQVLSTYELDQLTAEVQQGTSFNKLRDAALIMLILATGLRTEEVTELWFHEVYLREEYLRIIGKGNKERIVKIEAGLCHHACQLWHMARVAKLSDLGLTSEFYFITNRGQPLATALVYQQVSAYLNKINVKTEHKGAHTLRHTAASLMLRNKIPITTIQRNFGHENLNTTTKYLHLIANN